MKVAAYTMILGLVIRQVPAFVVNRAPRTITAAVFTQQQQKVTISSSSSSSLQMASGGRQSAAVTDKDLMEKTKKNKKSGKKQERLDTNPPKGTRDFFPLDMRLRNWLFDHWKEVARLYGFQEYDAPVLESEALYTRKAGEEVTQQLYNFEDKGGRAVALRPEMTPSLARMVMSTGGGMTMPLKWFSIPQCWRYERMTRGRRREHFQWNMDVWGVSGVGAEAELLRAMVTFFERVGITSDDVGIKVNSRLVIAEILTELGIPEEKFAATCVLVDKLEKVPLAAIQGELEELGLDQSVVERLLDVMSTSASKGIDYIKEVLGEESQAVQQLSQLLDLCKAYGIEDWVVLDATVVRGLAYYTGIVFEAFDRKGELRAIAGGGRYDKLLETFGGQPTPAAGFGFGDAVIVELLKERNILPTFDTAGIDAVVFAMNPDLLPVAIDAANKLRQGGLTVDLVLDKKKTKWVFKHADRIKANYCLIVAPDEYENGEVSIKNLTDGEQVTIKIDTLQDWASTTNSES